MLLDRGNIEMLFVVFGRSFTPETENVMFMFREIVYLKLTVINNQENCKYRYRQLRSMWNCSLKSAEGSELNNLCTFNICMQMHQYSRSIAVVSDDRMSFYAAVKIDNSQLVFRPYFLQEIWMLHVLSKFLHYMNVYTKLQYIVVVLFMILTQIIVLFCIQ